MKAMLEVDERHWWYRGRRRIVRAELDRLPVFRRGDGARRRLWLRPHAPGADRLRRGSRHRARPGLPPRTRPRRATARSGWGRLEQLPWQDDAFDLITCLDVIEHTPDDRVTLSELRRVSKPGGWLLVTVPAYQAPVVAARRGETTTTAATAGERSGTRRSRRAGGSTASPRSTASCCRPRRSCGSPSGAAGPTRTTPLSWSSGRPGSTRCSSAPCGSRLGGWPAGGDAPRGPLATRGAREPRTVAMTDELGRDHRAVQQPRLSAARDHRPRVDGRALARRDRAGARLDPRQPGQSSRSSW